MKLTILTMALAAALVPPAAMAQRIEKRKDAQQARIGQGIRSGELTAKEALKLEKKEIKLNREIRRDRLDGGGLTPRERVKIEHKQDKLSRQIAKEKHDKQERKY